MKNVVFDDCSLPEFTDTLLQEINSILSKLNPQRNRYDSLCLAYQVIDKINVFLKPYLPCKKGCDQCCKYDVLMTTFEAEYIAKNLTISINRSKNHSSNNHIPCPFLKNSICSIYEFRPYICRTYHVLESSEKCNPRKSSLITMYGARGGDYGNDIFAQIFNWIKGENNIFNGQIKDIRDFFV